MSDTSSRYQAGLSYAPGRAVGLYPDARDITQLPWVPVGSRTPVVYVPQVEEVATTDPIMLGLLPPPPEVQIDAAAPPPLMQAGDDAAAAGGGSNVLGLIARYAPRVISEISKQINRPDAAAPDALTPNPANLPIVPWGGPDFGYVPQGAHPFGDGGVYWSPDGIPSFDGAIVPGGWDAVPGGAAGAGWSGVGDFSYVAPGGNALGGGMYMAPGGTENLFEGAIVPKVSTDIVGGSAPAAAPTPSGGSLIDQASGAYDSVVGGVRDVFGTQGAVDAINASGIGSFVNPGISAIGGWLGGNAAGALTEGNGSPGNVSTGSAIGSAIGTLILPGPGTFIGSLLGGLAGGSINPAPDYDSAYAQFNVTPDGLQGAGLTRNNGPQDVADNLALQAQQYFADRAAREGLLLNPAMANQGFRFGVGQGDNGFGGWFLQPTQGDGTNNDIRPDLFGLYDRPQQIPGTPQGVADFVGYALQRPEGATAPTGMGAAPPGGPQAPQSLEQALDYGFGRLVDMGYYTQPGGPSYNDVQANIDAQRAYAQANPNFYMSGGDSAEWQAAPIADNFTYNAGWQPPGWDAAAYLSANPDVAAAGMDPLQHYMQFGIGEGRTWGQPVSNSGWSPGLQAAIDAATNG